MSKQLRQNIILAFFHTCTFHIFSYDFLQITVCFSKLNISVLAFYIQKTEFENKHIDFLHKLIVDFGLNLNKDIVNLLSAFSFHLFTKMFIGATFSFRYRTQAIMSILTGVPFLCSLFIYLLIWSSTYWVWVDTMNKYLTICESTKSVFAIFSFCPKVKQLWVYK